MLCVTGGEESSRVLADRLRAYEHYPLQEVRLDLLRDLDDSAFALLRGPRILATCRRADEGGGFRGSEAERLAILHRALREQPGYLDVEVSVEPSSWRALAEQRGTTQLVGSLHVLAPRVANLAAIGRALNAVPAQVLKLAMAVEDATELLALLELKLDRPLLRLGMGAAGLLSRALASRFGSPWTYVHADSSPPTAAGQLDASAAEAMRLDDERSLAPLVLLGGEQVMRSPGPRIYNRFFAQRGLPHLYLPVISRRPLELLQLLERLGVAGASVTMPLKESVLPLLDEVAPPADKIGAVNTVRLAAGRRRGWNSDAPAIAALCGEGAGRPALILGAGGAARAAAAALLEQRWAVHVTARTRSRAESLAESLGAVAVPWEERGRRLDALVINATPCGSDGLEDPLAERSDWRGAMVLDMVLARRRPTPLLQRARQAGARTIAGQQMWFEQGARQMSWLLGTSVRTDDLAGMLP